MLVQHRTVAQMADPETLQMSLTALRWRSTKADCGAWSRTSEWCAVSSARRAACARL